MTKEEKIKRFTELAQLEEIKESEIIQDEVEEVAPLEEETIPEYKPTAAEEAEMKMLRESKRKRFEQLAGVNNIEDSPKLEEQSQDIPSKFKKPTKFKVTLLSEGLRKEVSKLVKEGKTKISEFPEDIKKKVVSEMECYTSEPIEEDGMAALSTAPQGYPELDEFIERLSIGVKNLITKELGLNNEDPEMPYKAEYIVKGLIKGLKKAV